MIPGIIAGDHFFAFDPAGGSIVCGDSPKRQADNGTGSELAHQRAEQTRTLAD